MNSRCDECICNTCAFECMSAQCCPVVLDASRCPLTICEFQRNKQKVETLELAERQEFYVYYKSEIDDCAYRKLSKTFYSQKEASEWIIRRCVFTKFSLDDFQILSPVKTLIGDLDGEF